MYGFSRALRHAARTLFILFLVLVLLVGGYLLYLLLDYSRIPDDLPLSVDRSTDRVMETGVSYRALTYNIGFGAYSPDFTFFMDGGTESRARSRDSVLSLTGGALSVLTAEDADLYLLQEVDTDSDRSYHVNQQVLIGAAMPAYGAVYAENYHSSYLFYPFTEPHGASRSGILTLSRFAVSAARRRSLPISESLTRFLDLDRCYSVTRIPVAGGRELLVYNIHSSAYGGDPEIRTAQLTMLLGDMKREYDAGNYCLAGGDFNHDFTGDSTVLFNGAATDYGWALPFPTELLPEGITRAIAEEGTPIPTCRNCDVPYSPDSFTVIVDGFLTSANIAVEAVDVVDTGFAFSDHNPVRLTFTLLP